MLVWKALVAVLATHHNPVLDWERNFSAKWVSEELSFDVLYHRGCSMS